MSTQPLWLLALVAMGGGVAGGAAVYGLTPSSERATTSADKRATESRTSPGAHDDAADRSASDISERLQELEDQVRGLQRSLNARQELRRYAKALGDDDKPTDDSERSVVAADAEDPGFELAVRTVYDRIEWEKNEEEQAERTLRSQQRAEHQAEMLSEDLGLDSEQVTRVRTILSEQMAAFSDLRNPNNNTEARPRSREEWRERITAMRSKTDGKMEEVLSKEQLQKYRQIVEQQREQRELQGGRRIWR